MDFELIILTAIKAIAATIITVVVTLAMSQCMIRESELKQELRLKCFEKGWVWSGQCEPPPK